MTMKTTLSITISIFIIIVFIAYLLYLCFRHCFGNGGGRSKIKVRMRVSIHIREYIEIRLPRPFHGRRRVFLDYSEKNILIRALIWITDVYFRAIVPECLPRSFFVVLPQYLR